jgi:ribonuclease P protein component
MLPKKNRLDKKAIEKVFTKGIFINSPTLSFKFVKNPGSIPPRLSFVVPKSLVKGAVGRNKLRRQGYLRVEKYITSLPIGLSGAFVFKKVPTTQKDFENEIKNIIDKIN